MPGEPGPWAGRGAAKERVSVGVAPVPPHPKLSCRPGLQSGLDLEIGLCLLHGVFAQGSLSGEAYQLTFVILTNLQSMYTFPFIQKRS